MSEAELGAMFITVQAMVTQRNILEELVWKQPHSPIHIDNSAATGAVNNNIVPRKLKAMDWLLYWLSCQESQGQFRYYWALGLLNWGDYSTKKHPPLYYESKCIQFDGLTVHIHDVRSEPISV